MSFWSALLSGLAYIWWLFVDWLGIFISPIKNLELLWIIIPIWLTWFFAEFFQEKKGTSFGNAISNGAVPLWVGIDWTRYLLRLIAAGQLSFSWLLVFKFTISVLSFAYGLFIIIEGIKAKRMIHFIGRIREVTYILLMFSPIIYGVIDLNLRFILSIFLFFPVFYYLIELIDKITPNPKILKYDEEGLDEGEAFGKDLGGLDRVDNLKRGFG